MIEGDYAIRFREYLTYGLGSHYLLKVIIIQFVALLLTFQFARPLSISVSNPTLFIGAYTLISILFIAISLIFARNMCRRSLSPKMHNRSSVIISTLLYLIVAAVVVASGYTLLIIAVNGLSQINLLDIALSFLFVTALAAILTVGYHDEFDEELPSSEALEDAIDEWINATAWVDEEDNSQAQHNALNGFKESCDHLIEIFSNANTEAGEELAENIEGWVSDFNEHNGQGKEFVVGGQKDNIEVDQLLQRDHEEFRRVKSTLQEMSTKYD